MSLSRASRHVPLLLPAATGPRNTEHAETKPRRRGDTTFANSSNLNGREGRRDGETKRREATVASSLAFRRYELLK